MRSRVNTGDECPGGNSVFQTTFLFGPNSCGRPVVEETPVPFGPRNWVQSSAAKVTRVINGMMRTTHSAILGCHIFCSTFLIVFVRVNSCDSWIVFRIGKKNDPHESTRIRTLRQTRPDVLILRGLCLSSDVFLKPLQVRFHRRQLHLRFSRAVWLAWQ